MSTPVLPVLCIISSHLTSPIFLSMKFLPSFLANPTTFSLFLWSFSLLFWLTPPPSLFPWSFSLPVPQTTFRLYLLLFSASSLLLSLSLLEICLSLFYSPPPPILPFNPIPDWPFLFPFPAVSLSFSLPRPSPLPQTPGTAQLLLVGRWGSSWHRGCSRCGWRSRLNVVLLHVLHNLVRNLCQNFLGQSRLAGLRWLALGPAHQELAHRNKLVEKKNNDRIN